MEWKRIEGLEAEIQMSEYEDLKERYEAVEGTMECEGLKKKRKVEHEVEASRQLSHELSSKVGKDGPNLRIRLDDSPVDQQPASGAASDLLATPVSNVPSQDGGPKSRGISGTRVKRRLFAKEGEGEGRDDIVKMAPSTPGYATPSRPGFKICSSARSTDNEEEEAPESSSQKSKSNDFSLDYNTRKFIGRIPKTKIASKMDSKFNWGLYSDMRAALKVFPELCMMAVCVLYRQQTLEERRAKKTFDSNRRGFCKEDAKWASATAEFLTDGDILGDMNKSVEELRARFPDFDGAHFPDYDGYAMCQRMGILYWKQLLEIYLEKQDPFWQAAHK